MAGVPGTEGDGRFGSTVARRTGAPHRQTKDQAEMEATLPRTDERTGGATATKSTKSDSKQNGSSLNFA
jgi:hypothetical protein